MPVDVFNALTLQIIYMVTVGHQFFQLGLNAFIIGLHIDNGAQLVFIEKLIVFLFAECSRSASCCYVATAMLFSKKTQIFLGF